MSLVKADSTAAKDVNEFAKRSVIRSYQNCLTFPWIKKRVTQEKLAIHLWYFDIKKGEIFTYSFKDDKYHPLVF